MCALTSKDSNYPVKAACLEFCILTGQTPMSVCQIISTTWPALGGKAVGLPQMSSYYGFFYLPSGIFLQNLHLPGSVEGVAVLLACQRCEFL